MGEEPGGWGLVMGHRSALAMATATLVVASLALVASPAIAAPDDPVATTHQSTGTDGLVRDGSTPDLAAASCFEVKQNNPAAADGAYWLLTPKLAAPQQFYCDQTTDGGGWVLIGKGRDGWQSFYNGQGSANALLTCDRTPGSFGTVQLPSLTIDGLLNGADVKSLDDRIRVVRARNAEGTQWQTVRFGMPDRTRWTWAFGADHRVSAATFDGSGPFSGTTNWFGASDQWERVRFEFVARQSWRAGFGYGLGASGGSTSDTSFLYTPDGSGPLPYAEIYLRPQLLSSDLDFPRIPDAGTSAVTQRAMASMWASRTPWGVTGNLNGRVAEGNSPVQAFAQIGDVVYVGGNYTTVQRGSAATGDNVVARPGLAAFNASTGELIRSFTPSFNGQVKALAALPDGKLLVGGEFTMANGQSATSIALLNASTGATDPTWAATIENRTTSGVVLVRSISISGNFAYLGGSFTHLNGGGATNVYARNAARVDWRTGTPDRTWNPELNGTVVDTDTSADGSRLYAAGYFTKSQTTDANKATALQTGAGAPLVAQWNPVWSNGDRSGYQQAILDTPSRLYVGGSEHSIFGYDRQTFERKSGSITRGIGGDFQALARGNGVVYGGCHCASWAYQDAYKWPNPDAGWTQADKIQWVGAWDEATGDFIPTFNPQYLGSKDAGAWSLFVANDGALWVGGDFTGSRLSESSGQWNGGFVRFGTTDSVAPNTPGNYRQTATTSGTTTLAWSAPAGGVGAGGSYQVLRDNRVIATTSSTTITVPLAGERRYAVRATDAAGNLGASTPVLTVPGGDAQPNAQFVSQKSGLDVMLTAAEAPQGQSWSYEWTLGDGSVATTRVVQHSYLSGGSYPVRLRVISARDSWAASSQTVTIEQPVPADAYGAGVFGDGPRAYWRLEETAGGLAVDSSGSADHGSYQNGVTLGAKGVLPDTRSAQFDGVDDSFASSASSAAPQVFSTEAWFKTKTTRGGKIVGFGSSQTGLSNNYDRHVYMTDDGRLVFGVYSDGEHRISSPSSYNDGEWHHVVSMMSGDGMKLYVDGALVGTDTRSNGESTIGYWRVGGDRVWSGASSSYFQGSIDEVAIYPGALSAAQVAHHYELAAPPPNQRPTASFTYTTSGRTAKLDASASTDVDGAISNVSWDFGDGTTGSGALAEHTFADDGVYPVSLIVADDSGKTGAQAQFVGIGASVDAPTDAYGAAVFNDVPFLYWELEESSGTTATDSASGRNPGVYYNGVTLDDDGIRSANAARFDGVDDHVVATRSVRGPSTYSTEIWFTTTTTTGGKLIGFGDAASGESWSYDRHVTMRDDGRLTFGAYPGHEASVTSPTAYNDGHWHQTVATQSAEGMRLYVDGVEVARNTEAGAQDYSGYWRIGGDNVWSGTSSRYFAGTLDEAAVYSYALSPSQIAAHYAIGQQLPNEAPIAAFDFSASNLDVSFDGSASSDPDGTIAAVVWDFGDGSTSADGLSVAHSFARPGTYQVKLTVTDNQGGSASITRSVVVEAAPNEPPVASFAYDATRLDVRFDATTSSDPDGQVAAVSWDFGDSSPAADGVTVGHSYASAGSYRVTVTVKDDRGATSTASQWVSVTAAPANVPPTAAFEYDATYLDVSFDASGSTDPDGSIASVSWDFGDGTGTSHGEKIRHSFAQAGSFVVTLTVVDDAGASSSSTQTLDVAAAPNQAPIPSFTTSVNGLSISVDGSGSSDPDGSIAKVSWNFGDSSPAVEGVTVAHTYATAGTYSVTIMVTDNQGSTAAVTQQVAITEAPANQTPRASFTYATSGLHVAVDGSGSSDPDGSIASTRWDFGDGSAPAEGTSQEHTYPAPGTYTVTFTVTDDDGATSAAQQTVNVQSPPNQAPVASFAQQVSGLSVSLDASGSSDPDGSIASVAWDFGDSSPASSGTTVTHVYASEGTYPVTVTVTDNSGASSTATQTVTVSKPAGTPVTSRVVTSGSSWSYYYGTAAPPAGWAQRTFSDSSWSTGTGPVGYGSSVPATMLVLDPVAANRPRALYGRTSFEVLDASRVQDLKLSALADDGAVVYVNGVEVGRHNMSTNVVTHSTFADSARRVTAAQAAPLLVTVPVNLLVNGVNVIAVEAHVNYRSTPDLTIATTADITVLQ